MNRKLILLLLMLLFIIQIKAQSNSIRFDDGSSLIVVSEYQERENHSAKIEEIKEKDFIGEFFLSRKAGAIFQERILAKLTAINPRLIKQFGRNPSIYAIKQNGHFIDAAVFNSVKPRKLPVFVKGRAVVITLDEDGTKINVLIVKSICRIRKPK